jgi:hypothetical protein
MSKNNDEAWFAKNFPTPHARKKADEAIDKLSPTLSMTEFIDAWIAAYVAAGGKVNIRV